MTRRERLAHPLDDVPSIKLKLGFVIAAAVAVTVFVFWVLIKIGVWPSDAIMTARDTPGTPGARPWRQAVRDHAEAQDHDDPPDRRQGRRVNRGQSHGLHPCRETREE